MMDEYISTEDELNRVWRRYYMQRYYEEPTPWNLNYAQVDRRGYKARCFEDWLYDQGISVIQRNRKRYMRFFDRNEATMFILRYL
jgi:hypothetical protein